MYIFRLQQSKNFEIWNFFFKPAQCLETANQNFLMPTAGEYKHELSGIPCHCYVRRRIHRSLSRKPCLRKSHDHRTNQKPKNISFDPVLRIRSYKKDGKSDHCKLFHDRLSSITDLKNTAKNESGINSSVLIGHDKASRHKQSSNSILSQKQNTDSSIHKSEAFAPITQVSADLNNNVDYSHSLKSITCITDTRLKSTKKSDMSSQRLCSTCERDRSPTNQARSTGRPRERTPPCQQSSPTHLLQKFPGSKMRDPLQQPKQCIGHPQLCNKYNDNHRKNPPYGFAASQRISSGAEDLTNRFSTIPGTNRTLDNPAKYFNEYETRSQTMSIYDVKPPLTTFTNQSRGGTLDSIDSCSKEKQSKKFEDNIYETPDTGKADYEYVPIRIGTRRRSDSENFDSSLTIPVFESPMYNSGLIKHKTESDLTAEPEVNKCQDLPMPQSAPDLPAIVSRPYSIKFLNEPKKSYSRRSVNRQLEVDILTRIKKCEKFDVSSTDHKLNRCKGSLWGEIMRMTPVALFWTGCAFLVAVIYIFLFSCQHENE